ncbi:cation:proton antiporter [Sulfurovum sp. bin170]|uniref:cation:proton antiporter n=1 Tax=Sulfurovum sp. bin170 TaxID=2695268 RepID=UPI0013DF1C3D|nr:cation:proton antiporter [Sulfurovum sp. bin170]NEW59684.1 cation:proton antiporter [Sulfurovum sp. bin170]
MQTLLSVGLIFVLGAFMKWLCQKIKLLNVVGYLMLGLIIGPEVLGIIDYKFIKESHIITDMSLALISVLVGANLKYNLIKEIWKQIAFVSIFEALFTFIFISTSFYLLFDFLGLGFANEQRLTIAVLFGGLATATAPATVLAIIHELKAKGKFSSFLLGVVAFDNAIALILFSFVMIFTSTLIGSSEVSISTFFEVLPIIFYSIILGAVGAVCSEVIDRVFKKNRSVKTTSTLGMIFIVYSLSSQWGLEPLFASLVMGVVMANLSNEFFLVKEEFDHHLKDIIFLLFFAISAMHLNLSFLVSMPFIIILYVLFRIIGKVTGVWFGAKLTGADKNIQNYLGIALFPQAGIAIGLALSLQTEPGFESIAPIILNVIIATTMVHEFIGPLLTKYVLHKSGECNNDKCEREDSSN